jgi:cytidine deaminase
MVDSFDRGLTRGRLASQSGTRQIAAIRSMAVCHHGAMADDRVEQALALAREASSRAYAPYSGFQMGAAVGTVSGALVPGALVENVSLGLAMCAERVALFSAVAQGAGLPDLLVLVSPRTSGRLTYPCGACLQVALELADADLEVVVSDLGGVTERARLGDLGPRLPHKP